MIDEGVEKSWGNYSVLLPIITLERSFRVRIQAAAGTRKWRTIIASIVMSELQKKIRKRIYHLTKLVTSKWEFESPLRQLPLTTAVQTQGKRSAKEVLDWRQLHGIPAAFFGSN